MGSECRDSDSGSYGISTATNNAMIYGIALVTEYNETIYTWLQDAMNYTEIDNSQLDCANDEDSVEVFRLKGNETWQ